VWAVGARVQTVSTSVNSICMRSAGGAAPGESVGRCSSAVRDDRPPAADARLTVHVRNTVIPAATRSPLLLHLAFKHHAQALRDATSAVGTVLETGTTGIRWMRGGRADDDRSAAGRPSA
jgi:hypothetical protein